MHDNNIVTNQLTVRFGGKGNIRVETLTEFLDQYKQLFYIINSELGYGPDDMIVEVSPPEHGSFKINIKPKYKDLILDKMGDLSVGVLIALIAVFTANYNNLTLEDVEELLKKKELNLNGIPKVVNHIYNSPVVQQKIQQTFIIINKDDNITNLKIEQDDKEYITITKSEFSQIIASHSITEINEVQEFDILTDEATLVIKTIHFEGQSKWAFIYRGYPIKASINKNSKFMESLSSQSFRKGDILKVILSRKRNYDQELQTYLVDQNSYIIDEVLDHKSKTDNQNKLEFE